MFHIKPLVERRKRRDDGGRKRMGDDTRKLSDAMLDETMRMVAAGRPQTQVAAMFGVHRKTLADNLDRRRKLVPL